MPSSNESLTCRIDWRPSSLLLAAIALLIVLAAGSAWLSAMPAWLACLVTLACLGHGLWLGRREALRPRLSVFLAGEPGEAVLNFPHGTESWTQARVSFRGPLATLAGHDAAGRTRRLSWWPDTLPAAARRQLRLVAGRLPAAFSPSALPPGS